jgi:hypothetical protein
MAKLGMVWETLPAFRRRVRIAGKRAIRIPRGIAIAEAKRSEAATRLMCSKVF